MRRGHSKLKRIVHDIEALLQNTLLTCCYRALFAMASESPAMTLDAAMDTHQFQRLQNLRARHVDVCLCACMYVPAAVLGACRVYMLCIFLERPRQRLSA